MIKIMKASAGSGKTYSLARTYISLLLRSKDPHAYRHILAVTFTNKATDEMKNRILKELYVLASDPQKSAYFRDFVPSVISSEALLQKKAQDVLHDILHDYSAFAVSTIDRFFQQTLKAFSREIGQFASYQVELDRDSLVAESVDRLLDSLTEDSGSLLSWLTGNVLEQIEQGGRYSMDANLLNMAVRLKSLQRQTAMEEAGIDEDKVYSKESLVKLRGVCRDIVSSFRKDVKEKARRILDILEEAGVDPADSNRGFLKALYVYDELQDNDAITAPKDTFLMKASDSSQWFAKTKAAKLLPLVYPFMEAPLDDFCELWKKDFAVYNTAVILDGQIYGLGVAAELRQTFNDLMKEKNILCIDDSNTILRDIIDGSDAPFVYEKLGVRFDHFLLDEFQDTSDVQWTNFSPLLHNSDSQGGENLIVGDVKQSIYRWRGSDWKLLDEKIPDEFPDHVEEVLDTNYRSLSNVVGFNNAFFEASASVLDRISGHDGNGQLSRIYSDVGQKVAKKETDGGIVELTFCDKTEELAQVLDAVSAAREAGAALSDIAVLVRSNVIGENVASYLIENGLPVMTDDSLKVKNSITVRRLVSLMSYVDNPDDTVNGFLAGSLDVPVPDCGLSLIDMAEFLIRSLKASDDLWKGEIPHIQSFMDCIKDYVSSNGNNLRGFLKHWEGEDPSVCSPSAGNCIRVMTIHKSKGLDFPYVIIPFAENITLYKPGNRWCAPDLAGTALSGVADGVYDVQLSGNSESTLFAEHYRNERFLQQVDNINTIYVAMTRAALGLHVIAKTPPAKLISALKDGVMPEFKDFSQMLYHFACSTGMDVCEEEGTLRFTCGQMPCFGAFRKEDRTAAPFFMSEGDGYPSVPLNPQSGDPECDVRERGRLKFSADSLDFFSEDGEAGIGASNRVKGIVLHDILSSVVVMEDLDAAVQAAFNSGELSAEQMHEVKQLLENRLIEAEKLGWFPNDGTEVLNEVSLIDTDGKVYRPDRVVKTDDRVIIIDYKFGAHERRYERQMLKYADLWRRMGYGEVSAYLWYVHSGEVVEV
ncbi:MAG: UvrD-helicase domain-containing protein [Bacteroidales bacterium]|nr:UvrD-helicase domain-containing protein [Bacteroidales bacterium]